MNSVGENLRGCPFEAPPHDANGNRVPALARSARLYPDIAIPATRVNSGEYRVIALPQR